MVVVGDDEIDAELAREQGLAHGGDAAVDGHDDARPVRGELAERLAVEAVALLVAVRDVRADDRAELAERRDGDRRAGDAVDVVVPVDDDALASRERTMEALERPVHIAHRRALLRGDPGRQEVGHLRRADAPPGEDPRDERGDTIGDIPDPLCGHYPATLRHEAHPTFKYPALVFAIGLALVSCVPPATGPGASTPGAGGQTRATATANPTIPGLAQAPHAIFGPIRAWYLVPDPAFREDVHLAVTFPDGDPTDGRPRARLRSNGRVIDLVRSRDLPASWQAELPLDGAPPGDQRIEILVRLRDGTDASLATRDFVLSAPEYVVWTLDFEGDASGDAELANAAAIADGLRVPMTIMWNPRVWTTTQVSPARAEAMLAWTKARGSTGDEIALHLHMWTDYVRAAGLVPRTVPSWAGRLDGYDVPMTAYNEIETRTLLDHALRLMADHGLSRPLTFRAGGDFANAENLRAVAAAGFVADCTAVPAGAVGRLTPPWAPAPPARPPPPPPRDAEKPRRPPLPH